MARIRTFGIMGFLAVLLAVFAYVAASGGSSEVTDEPPRRIEPREKEPVSQVGQGGTARMMLPVSMRPGCLNPYLPGCRGAENLNGVVLEGPLALAPSGEHRPALAAGMPSYAEGSLSLEPMTIELRIRPNAAFSDGEPVTSEDVKWTYEQAADLADEGRISPAYSGFARLDGVEATGPKTVSLAFDGPYSEWQSLLTAPVLPEHVYGEGGGGLSSLPLDENPVGSGPFLLGGTSEEGIAFSANARYWRAMFDARLDGLEVEFAGPRRASESLASGRADFGFFTQPGSAPDSGGLLRSEAHRDRTETLVFNSRRMDGELREAVTESLDRGAMLPDGLDAAGSVFPGVESPESGWQSGGDSQSAVPAEPLRLAYPTGGPARDGAAEEAARQLEASGVVVEVERLPPEEYYRDALPSGDFDLTMVDFAFPAEYEAITPFLPENSARAVSLSLSEMEDRDSYFAQTQRIMASEDALLPLYVWPDSYAWTSTLSGPEPETPQRAVTWNVEEWGFFK